jgi:hypothetical protein
MVLETEKSKVKGLHVGGHSCCNFHGRRCKVKTALMGDRERERERERERMRERERERD